MRQNRTVTVMGQAPCDFVASAYVDSRATKSLCRMRQSRTVQLCSKPCVDGVPQSRRRLCRMQLCRMQAPVWTRLNGTGLGVDWIDRDLGLLLL